MDPEAPDNRPATPEFPIPVINPGYDQVARDSLTNAQSHWESAAAVATKGHFGTALSLSVLGLEELAKALHYRLCAVGLATFDQDHAGQTVLVDGQAVEMKRLTSEGALHSQHREKLTFLASLEFSADLMSFAIGRVADQLEAEGTLDLEDPKLNEAAGAVVSKALEKMERMAELNERKKAGLYVGNGTGSSTTPGEVEESEYAEAHDLLRKRLDQLGPFISGDPDGMERMMSQFMESSGLARIREIAARSGGIPKSPDSRDVPENDSPKT